MVVVTEGKPTMLNFLLLHMASMAKLNQYTPDVTHCTFIYLIIDVC
jgi:hypothetical protein